MRLVDEPILNLVLGMMKQVADDRFDTSNLDAQTYEIESTSVFRQRIRCFFVRI